MAKRRQVKSKPCHGTPPACTAGELSPAVWSILALTYHKILFNKRKIATIEWVSTTCQVIHTHTHTHTQSKYAYLYNLSIHTAGLCIQFWLTGLWAVEQTKVLKAQRWYKSFLRVENRYCSFLYLYHFTLFWVLLKSTFKTLNHLILTITLWSSYDL